MSEIITINHCCGHSVNHNFYPDTASKKTLETERLQWIKITESVLCKNCEDIQKGYKWLKPNHTFNYTWKLRYPEDNTIDVTQIDARGLNFLVLGFDTHADAVKYYTEAE